MATPMDGFYFEDHAIIYVALDRAWRAVEQDHGDFIIVEIDPGNVPTAKRYRPETQTACEVLTAIEERFDVVLTWEDEDGGIRHFGE